MTAVVGRWLRRQTAGRWLRRLPWAVVAVALVVLLVRNADGPVLPDYEVPAGFEPAPAPTTAPPGAVPRNLPAVGGTTTSTIPANAGAARLAGVVTGPGGAVVPGATVRIERAVGGTTQVVDAVSGPDGRYDVPGIGGGRYRVRAFLPPTLAQAQGTVLYLRHDEERTVDLGVDEYAEPAIAVAYAPDPPLLDAPLNLAVRVSGRLVDADGVVRTQPLVGGSVRIVATGGWQPSSTTFDTTDGNGEARFAFTCRSTAPARLDVTVTYASSNPTPTTTQDVPSSTVAVSVTTSASFDVAACVDPATLTTTTTTVPGDPGSSTTDDTTPPSTDDTSTTVADTATTAQG